MIFENLSFPLPSNRPFFYTSFVSTLDGKIFVKAPGYWPIGSSIDYELFTFLRAHADVIIDGRNTAITFGPKTIQTIHTPSFLSLREKLGKEKPLEYLILTKDATSVDFLNNNPYRYKPLIEKYSSLDVLIKELQKRGYKKVFIDGGPTLLRSFIAENFLDELFLTISPKIFGGKSKEFLTMIEGDLFPLKNIPTMTLVSVSKQRDEVFLRYRNPLSQPVVE